MSFNPAGAVRCWLNMIWSGGTPTLQAGFGVSSFTDSGVGWAAVNFTAAWPDANYTMVGSAQTDTSGSIGTGNSAVVFRRATSQLTTTVANFQVLDFAGNTHDATLATIIFVGGSP